MHKTFFFFISMMCCTSLLICSEESKAMPKTNKENPHAAYWNNRPILYRLWCDYCNIRMSIRGKAHEVSKIANQLMPDINLLQKRIEELDRQTEQSKAAPKTNQEKPYAPCWNNRPALYLFWCDLSTTRMSIQSQAHDVLKLANQFTPDINILQKRVEELDRQACEQR